MKKAYLVLDDRTASISSKPILDLNVAKASASEHRAPWVLRTDSELADHLLSLLHAAHDRTQIWDIVNASLYGLVEAIPVSSEAIASPAKVPARGQYPSNISRAAFKVWDEIVVSDRFKKTIVGRPYEAAFAIATKWLFEACRRRGIEAFKDEIHHLDKTAEQKMFRELRICKSYVEQVFRNLHNLDCVARQTNWTALKVVLRGNLYHIQVVKRISLKPKMLNRVSLVLKHYEGFEGEDLRSHPTSNTSVVFDVRPQQNDMLVNLELTYTKAQLSSMASIPASVSGSIFVSMAQSWLEKRLSETLRTVVAGEREDRSRIRTMLAELIDRVDQGRFKLWRAAGRCIVVFQHNTLSSFNGNNVVLNLTEKNGYDGSFMNIDPKKPTKGRLMNRIALSIVKQLANKFGDGYPIDLITLHADPDAELTDTMSNPAVRSSLFQELSRAADHADDMNDAHRDPNRDVERAVLADARATTLEFIERLDEALNRAGAELFEAHPYLLDNFQDFKVYMINGWNEIVLPRSFSEDHFGRWYNKLPYGIKRDLYDPIMHDFFDDVKSRFKKVEEKPIELPSTELHPVEGPRSNAFKRAAKKLNEFFNQKREILHDTFEKMLTRVKASAETDAKQRLIADSITSKIIDKLSKKSGHKVIKLAFIEPKIGRRPLHVTFTDSESGSDECHGEFKRHGKFSSLELDVSCDFKWYGLGPGICDDVEKTDLFTTISHEVMHLLDSKKTLGRDNDSYDRAVFKHGGIDQRAYFNTPAEKNAYLQSMILEWSKRGNHDDLQKSFPEFYSAFKAFWEDGRQENRFFSYLDSSGERRVINRLYNYWLMNKPVEASSKELRVLTEFEATPIDSEKPVKIPVGAVLRPIKREDDLDAFQIVHPVSVLGIRLNLSVDQHENCAHVDSEIETFDGSILAALELLSEEFSALATLTLEGCKIAKLLGPVSTWPFAENRAWLHHLNLKSTHPAISFELVPYQGVQHLAAIYTGSW